MYHAFEGPEKKLEINLMPGTGNFRSWGDEQWSQVVGLSNATILSKVSSESCDAYLLSESSLIVWDECVVMITCGTTTLIKAAEYLVDKVGKDNIDSLFFERKNEYFPFAQKTDFRQDVLRLKEIVNGDAYQFGRPDEHHIYLYLYNNPKSSQKIDNTLEILMYDMGGKTREVFQTENLNTDEIRKRTGIDRILPGYKVDDFSFKPFGYSLNAVKGPLYYTIHVTPQQDSPYVSFETNQAKSHDLDGVINSVLETFQPRSFDIMFFDPNANEEILDINGYEKRSSVCTELYRGLCAQYGHFSKSVYEQLQPLKLNF